MLGKIRDQAGSWFFKIFLTIIALSFVLWGVGEFATGSLNSTAITINNTKIPATTVNRAYQNAVRSMEKRIGNELSDVHKQQLRIGERTVGSIIRETLLTDYARDLDLRIAPEQLNTVLRSMKNFQNADGEFDKNIYRNSLKDQHDMTIEGFEKIVTGQLSRLALNTVFDVPALADVNTIKRVAETNKEELDINIIIIASSDIKNIKTPTLEEQRAFYNNDPSNWKTKEERSFNVLNISAEQIAKGIAVTDSEAREVYKDKVDSYNVSEQRVAQHILLKTKKEAEDLLSKINKGEDFSKLAKKYSIDKFTAKKGGDLGKFTADSMVESFSDAVFAMKKGGISNIIKSTFGFHIVKLNNILPAYLQPFNKVKKSIKKSIAFQKAEEIYAKNIEEIEDYIAGGEKLDKIANDLNLSITSNKNKSLLNSMTNNISPEKIIAMRRAFTTENGEISDKIDLSDTSAIYVEVTNIIEPAVRSFKDVQKDVLGVMLKGSKMIALSKKVNKLYKLNKKGKSLKEIAKSENLKYESIANINKYLNNAPTWFSWSLASQFFDNPKAKYLSTPVTYDNGNKHVIVELSGRHTPAITKDMLEETKQLLTKSISNDLRLQYIKYLYKNADISFNIPLLRQAMPGEIIEEERITN